MQVAKAASKPSILGRARPVEMAKVIFQGRSIATPVYERPDLSPGRLLKSPAIITEYTATTVIPPGAKFKVDRAGNLLITIK
jgi:N-methylhydantoinase A